MCDTVLGKKKYQNLEQSVHCRRVPHIARLSDMTLLVLDGKCFFFKRAKEASCVYVCVCVCVCVC